MNSTDTEQGDDCKYIKQYCSGVFKLQGLQVRTPNQLGMGA